MRLVSEESFSSIAAWEDETDEKNLILSNDKSV